MAPKAEAVLGSRPVSAHLDSLPTTPKDPCSSVLRTQVSGRLKLRKQDHRMHRLQAWPQATSRPLLGRL